MIRNPFRIARHAHDLECKIYSDAIRSLLSNLEADNKMIKKLQKKISHRLLRLKKLVIRTLRQHLDRQDLSHLYLKGNGIEIGALHQPLKLPKNAKVKYVDRMSSADLRKQYPDLNNFNIVEVDILDNGETLSTIPPASQDFVIANHFLEHCQNPINALANMHRVLREKGILYLALPDKRYTFDIDRPVTPFEHLLTDYRVGPEGSKRAHFEEWTRLVDKVNEEKEFADHMQRIMGMDYSIHYHVWTQSEMLELIYQIKKLGISFDVELCLKRDFEFIFILRKMTSNIA